MNKFFSNHRCLIISFFTIILLFSALFAPCASAQTVNLREIVMAGAELSVKEQLENWDNLVAVSVSSGKSGDFVLGLQADGHVLAAGVNDKGQCQVDSWEDVVEIAAGDSVALGLRSDGRVLCAGYCQRCAPQVDSWENVCHIAAGSEFVLGIDDSGQQLFSGLDEFNINIWFAADRDNKVWPDKEDEIRFWSELSDIRAAGDAVLAVDFSGELRGFGFNSAVDLPDIPEFSKFDMGILNGGILDSEGFPLVWGDNSYKQCELPQEKFSDIGIGGAHVLLRRADGSCAAFGCNDSGQCQVEGWDNVVYISAGKSCSLGITGEGKLLIAGVLY